MVTQLGSPRLAQSAHERPAQAVFALIVVVEDAEDVEQCTFTGPGRAHDGHQFPLLDVKVDAPQHMERRSVMVSLVNVFQMYHAVVYKYKCVTFTVCIP